MKERINLQDSFKERVPAAKMDRIVAWGAAICVLIAAVLACVIETGFWKFLVGVGAAAALVGILFWVLLYRGGDVATADARDANLQVVKVVQPIGDPNVDEAYADINRTNAGTNAANAGANAIYIVLFFVSLVVVVGLFVFLSYFINK